jgi:hypothetical protein
MNKRRSGPGYVRKGRTDASIRADGLSGARGQRGRMGGSLGIIHIPKTGGVALREALAGMPGCYAGPLYFDPAHFGSAELLDAVPEPNRSAVATSGALADLVPLHQLLIGHYSARTLIEAGCTALASQVREPRARILSLYRFWQSTPADERASWGLWGSSLIARADLPFDRFLASTSVWPALENSMARQLLGQRLPASGLRSVPTRRPMASRSAYSELIKRMRVLEWSDRADDFLQRVCDAIGVADPPSPERVNVTKVSGEPQRFTPKTLRLLDRITAADRDILDALMSDRLLPLRRPHQFDEAFADTAERLEFHL